MIPKGRKVGTLAEIVGRNVRELREERKLSQPGLGALIADMLGRDPIPKQVISKIEHGRRSLSAEELVATSLTLGAPVSTLLSAHGHLDLDVISISPDTESWEMTLAELREAVIGDAEAAARMEVRRNLIEQIIRATESDEALPIRPVKSKSRSKPRRKRT